LVVRRISKPVENLPDDPAELSSMIAALQVENARIEAENAKMLATLRVHDQLVQALRLRIAKLQKLAFGKSLETIEREIEQLELALEDLLVAVAEDASIDEGPSEPSPETADAPALRRRPRVSDTTPRERRELDPGACCLDCGGDLRLVSYAGIWVTEPDQAAPLAATPSVNLTTLITIGNRLAPFRRRHVLATV